MNRKVTSNYDKLCVEWAERISGMDIARLMTKLPELKKEDSYLTLMHFGRQYGISLEDFIIHPLDGGQISSNARLNIYTLLWYCKENACRSDEFRPFETLRSAGPFGPAFKKGVLQPFASAFSGKTEQLKAAFEALGAKPLPVSDAGYQLNAFGCMPVQFYFWDGDDEFPAQANILFDYNCTDFIHVESIVTIATEGVRRIAEAAGVSLDRNAF